MEYKIEIRIQTNGIIKPMEAFSDALDSLVQQLDKMEDEYEVNILCNNREP